MNIEIGKMNEGKGHIINIKKKKKKKKKNLIFF